MHLKLGGNWASSPVLVNSLKEKRLHYKKVYLTSFSIILASCFSKPKPKPRSRSKPKHKS